VPRLLASLNRLFDGTFDGQPGVVTRRFRRMHVRRPAPGPVQIDGELISEPAEVRIMVHPGALTVLVPSKE
jgi:diacylglycerol kinase family enzyme